MHLEKEIAEWVELEESKELLTEMSNLIKRKTGLPVNIWLDDIGSNRKVEHNTPRIKMQNNYNERADENTISISIDKNNPKILARKLAIRKSDYNKVVQWIKDNFEILDDYWYGRIDIEEVRDRIFK